MGTNFAYLSRAGHLTHLEVHLMNSSITAFIRSAASRENAPLATELEAAREALGSLLIQEMHRAGYWHRPPAHLGMPWAHDWSEARAFEELLADCFAFTLLLPFGTLVELSRIHPQVDALVADGVGWFLADTERLFDPLGHGLRKRFQATVRGMVRRGTLHIVAGDPRIDLHTTLGFASGAKGTARGTLPSPDDFHTATELWSEDLMPDLLTARGTRRHHLTQRVEEGLLSLSDDGIESFRLVDLVSAVRDAIDKNWRHTHMVSQAPRGPALPNLEIPEFFRERQPFRTFLACVGDSIDHLTTDQVTHGHLSSLWVFLRHLIQQGTEQPASTEALQHHLAIPADQIHPACSTLRRLVDFCHGSAHRDPPRDPSPEVDRTPNLSLTAELLQETRSAQARIYASEDFSLGKSLASLRPGRFFVTRAAAEPPVFWLVAATDQAAGCLHVVAADPMPLLSSHDLPIEVAGLGSLKLRCGFELEIPTELDGFADALVPLASAALPPNELERINHHRSRLATGQRLPDLTGDDTDSDPAMDDWVNGVLAPASRRLESLFLNPGNNQDSSPRERSSQSTKAARFFFLLTTRSAATGLIALAFLLLLALAIFLHCGQQAPGHPQHPMPPIAARDCGTLLRTPQWCGEPEEIVDARADLHPHMINLPQGGRPAGRTLELLEPLP